MNYIVTDIKKKSEKSRSSIVFINYEDAFALYNSEIAEIGLEIDDEISEETLEHIYKEILEPRCYKRALNIIIRKSVSTFEMKQKLSKDYYPEVISDAVIEKLIKERFLNDERFAESYISYYAQTKSMGIIKRELAQKGIKEDLIERLMEDECVVDADHEYNLCMKMLSKKYDKSNGEYAYIQKAKQFLYRKGFSFDVINRCVSDFFEEQSDYW